MKHPLGLILALLAVPQLATAAYAPPTNVTMTREGTTLTVTWEHEGGAKAFSVWQDGSNLSGGAYPGDTRSATVAVPSAVEAPELCELRVVARYLPEQPNLSSERMCVGTAEPDPAFTAVEVSWTPPTQREDGSALAPADIAGYQLYWDSADPPTGNKIEAASSPASVSLPDGVWYIALQTVDTKGNLSALSTPAVRVQLDPAADPLAAPKAPAIIGIEVQSGTGP